ncbi:MAG TPA: sigma-70 family RNA polymerase sigma factor [Vicinamibacterales bacterium]|jgi:RNA polymerase sigma factor (TIGR02999 family)|nr:sigma-70 family RNA polymerase sigma factor [Vicinamibacterales bacterium]
MADLPDSDGVTQLLVQWQNGDQKALDSLIPLVYQELRAIAGRYLSRESPSHTLQSTALVHEAYFKLIGQRRVRWQNRAHFFGIAAQMMRRILIDHARHQARDKRGGPAPKLSLDDAMATAEAEADIDLLALDDALTALAQIDPRGAQIIELRFFSGLSLEETAEVVGVSAGTVKRDWSAARAWLYREMRQHS